MSGHDSCGFCGRPWSGGIRLQVGKLPACDRCAGATPEVRAERQRLRAVATAQRPGVGEVFDPEKVRTFWLDFEDDLGGAWEDDFVFARDYHALLELYRARVASTDEVIRRETERIVGEMMANLKKEMEAANAL